MSFRVVAKVLDLEGPKLAKRLVLIALAEAAHDDGIVWLDQATIARKAAITENHARECLRLLASDDLGLLEVRKAQVGRRRFNVYRIMLPGLADPDYSTIPFKFDSPFTTTELPRSSESTTTDPSFDDHRSVGPTTTDPSIPPTPPNKEEPSYEPPENRREDPPPGGSRKLTVVEIDLPPKIEFVNGRNLAIDALVEVCGIDPAHKARMTYTARALNGRSNTAGKVLEQGIVHLFWIEMNRYVAEHPEWQDRFEEVRASPALFSEALAKAIHRRAEVYKRVMDGALMTPSALRSWWLELEGQRAGAAEQGIAAEDVEQALRDDVG